MTDPSAALARGTMWSVGLRWFIKLVGLLSTIVLARFLSPADYGVMVMATLVIGLVEVFFFAAADTALLRSPDAPDALINSAWTLRLVQAMLVCAVVILLSPLASLYFSEPRVVPVMIVLAVGIVVAAFANIGPVLARKNLDFGLEVRIGVWTKSVSFLATVAAAYWLRSYWALVIGIYVSHALGIYLSYRWHPYRPRWDLSRVRELWSFSQWMLVSGIGSFFGKKTDELILGHLGSAKDLGYYNVASEIGQTVTVEISAPVNRSLFPVLSSMHGQPQERLKLFFSTLAFINTLTIPTGIGLFVLAALFVRVVLGQNWMEIVPVLQVFALQGVVRFLVSPYYVWFMVVGRSKVLAAMSWAEMFLFLGFAYLFYERGIIGFALARLCTTGVIVLFWIVIGMREGLLPMRLASAIVRPVLAGISMGAALWPLYQMWTPPNALVGLLALSLAGALMYACALVLTWLAAGRPQGPEHWFLKKMRILA